MQRIQAKEGFRASARCFSFSTALSLQRIDQLKTDAMQCPWYSWGTKGENLWSSELWNLLCADTPEQKILLPRHCTVKEPDVLVASSLSGHQAPGCFPVFLQLSSPACSRARLLRWVSEAAPLLLPCCCAGAQLDGAHGVAAGVQS